MVNERPFSRTICSFWATGVTDLMAHWSADAARLAQGAPRHMRSTNAELEGSLNMDAENECCRVLTPVASRRPGKVAESFGCLVSGPLHPPEVAAPGPRWGQVPRPRFIGSKSGDDSELNLKSQQVRSASPAPAPRSQRARQRRHIAPA